VGPSTQFNYFGWDGQSLFSPSIGGLFGVQVPIKSKHALNFSLNTHWSKHRNYSYYDPNIDKQTDLIFDFRTEARLHLTKNYPNLFFGAGIGLRYLLSYNYDPQFTSPDNPAVKELSVYGNLSIGENIIIANHDFSYECVIGVSNWGEYLSYIQLNL